VAVWIVVPWSSVKDGDAMVVQAAGLGKMTRRGWLIDGVDSTLEQGPQPRVHASSTSSRVHSLASSLHRRGH
jgi:hypothetical protein